MCATWRADMNTFLKFQLMQNMEISPTDRWITGWTVMILENVRRRGYRSYPPPVLHLQINITILYILRYFRPKPRVSCCMNNATHMPNSHRKMVGSQNYPINVDYSSWRFPRTTHSELLQGTSPFPGLSHMRLQKCSACFNISLG